MSEFLIMHLYERKRVAGELLVTTEDLLSLLSDDFRRAAVKNARIAVTDNAKKVEAEEQNTRLQLLMES